MINQVYLEIIENYIKAYNSFDIDKMLADMDSNVRFENISNGEVDLATTGIAALKNQAEQAMAFFKERKQAITGSIFDNEKGEISIVYWNFSYGFSQWIKSRR